MMVGIEFLIISILLSFFTKAGILNVIYIVASLFISIGYYLLYLKEYKKLDKLDQDRAKTQISYKLIIVSIMILTINIVYPLGLINLIIGYALLVYFALLFVYRVRKNKVISKPHLMNFTYFFDVYSLLCLCSLLGDVISYAI